MIFYFQERGFPLSHKCQYALGSFTFSRFLVGDEGCCVYVCLALESGTATLNKKTVSYISFSDKGNVLKKTIFDNKASEMKT